MQQNDVNENTLNEKTESPVLTEQQPNTTAKFTDILDFILDEEYSSKDQNEKLRQEFFDTKITRLFILPKIKQIEDTIVIFSDTLKKTDLDVEKLTYAIKTHEKQILVLERFIEQQNVKNEQIHFEIASLKLTLESIQAQLTSIINFIERQTGQNEQVHKDVNTLKGNVEIIQQQTSSILSGLNRIGDNFDKHIDETKSFFLEKTQQSYVDSKENTLQLKEDIEKYKFLIKIGYWIAGTLGAISFIILSIYTVLTGKTLPAFLLEVLKMLPWS